MLDVVKSNWRFKPTNCFAKSWLAEFMVQGKLTHNFYSNCFTEIWWAEFMVQVKYFIYTGKKSAWFMANKKSSFKFAISLHKKELSRIIVLFYRWSPELNTRSDWKADSRIARDLWESWKSTSAHRNSGNKFRYSNLFWSRDIYIYSGSGVG